MNGFLPTGYAVPKAPSDYMKFEDGKNKFRILSAPLMGFMYWTKDKKPVRQAEPFEGTPADTGERQRLMIWRCLITRRR